MRGKSPIKSRATNRQDRHLLTRYIVDIVTEHGVEMPEQDLAKLAPSRLNASILNRQRQWLSFDVGRMTREPPAIRFQAELSKAL